MASRGRVEQRLRQGLRPLGYGAAALGFTALALLVLHLLLAQRLAQQQRRQLVNQVGPMVLLSEVALERYSPAELAELMGIKVAVGARPPRAGTPQRPADGALRRQAEDLRADLCRKLTSCPQVWPAGRDRSGEPGRGAWVQLNTPLEASWLFAPMAASRRWPPDGALLSLAGGLGGLATLLLYLSLEVQRPLRQLDGALAEVGIDAQPQPVAARGTPSVRRLTRHFNTMLARLRLASQERATMLGGIAHDLRAPLTRLRLRLAQPGPWSEEERRRAEGDLNALAAITEQFLLFVGAERQENAVVVPLAELVGEAAAAVEAVELDLEPLERRVRPIGLSRAVANLLRNARDHGQPPLRLVLRGLSAEGFAIEVWDGGAGLAGAEWERAKQPFQRLDPARGGLGHSGLGLAIVERVARAHGGTLSCRREPTANGAAFVVRLSGSSVEDSGDQSHLVTDSAPPVAIQ
ncbi:MAG: ATP-binding protein [Cyanobacteriota bacterium]|nr:ATP-binding protein [Cyanobacteriota bacterium]